MVPEPRSIYLLCHDEPGMSDAMPFGTDITFLEGGAAE
jgi:hypothetical protein